VKNRRLGLAGSPTLTGSSKLTETENTPQLGHADAVTSAVTTCTTDPAPERIRLDPFDLKAVQVEKTRGVRHRIHLNMGNSRRQSSPVASLQS